MSKKFTINEFKIFIDKNRDDLISVDISIREGGVVTNVGWAMGLITEQGIEIANAQKQKETLFDKNKDNG